MAPFTLYRQLARLPINVIQCHVDDFTRPQTKASQQEQNRVIALSRRAILITFFQQEFHLLCRQMLRYRRQTPGSHRGNACRKVRRDVTTLVKRPEKAPENARRALTCCRTNSACLAEQALGHVSLIRLV